MTPVGPTCILGDELEKHCVNLPDHCLSIHDANSQSLLLSDAEKQANEGVTQKQ